VLDGSGSLDAAEFALAESFVKSIYDSFDISAAGAHVGLVLYSTTSVLISPLTGVKSELVLKTDAMAQR
jgi:hypothetical protein